MFSTILCLIFIWENSLHNLMTSETDAYQSWAGNDFLVFKTSQNFKKVPILYRDENSTF